MVARGSQQVAQLLSRNFFATMEIFAVKKIVEF